MKKRWGIVSFITLALTTTAVNACPKGTHPSGGIGPHHKGGTCTVITIESIR